MPHIKIEMTEEQLLALDMIATDRQEWADNVLTERARIAKEGLKVTSEWTQAAVGLADDGGNLTDDWAILRKGRDMGLFLTAKERASKK